MTARYAHLSPALQTHLLRPNGAPMQRENFFGVWRGHCLAPYSVLLRA
jgi:hypothetical protein